MKEQFSIKNEASKQGFTVRQKGYFYKLSFLEHYLKGHNGFIAGGCFKDIFTGKQVKDIDIFFRSEKDFEEAKSYYIRWGWDVVYENANAISFKDPENGMRIELIKRVFGSPEYLMSQFDLSICKFAYIKLKNDVSKIGFGESFNEERFEAMYYPQFFEDLTQRKLVYDNGIVNPIQSFDRLLRYIGYGFIIDKEQKTKLAQSISNLGEFSDEDLNDDGYFG